MLGKDALKLDIIFLFANQFNLDFIKSHDIAKILGY